jgi:hypothetical protein
MELAVRATNHHRVFGRRRLQLVALVVNQLVIMPLEALEVVEVLTVLVLVVVVVVDIQAVVVVVIIVIMGGHPAVAVGPTVLPHQPIAAQ